MPLQKILLPLQNKTSGFGIIPYDIVPESVPQHLISLKLFQVSGKRSMLLHTIDALNTYLPEVFASLQQNKDKLCVIFAETEFSHLK